MVDCLPGSSTPLAGDLCLSITGAVAFGADRENGLRSSQDSPAIANGERNALVFAGQHQTSEGVAGMDLKGRDSLPGTRPPPGAEHEFIPSKVS